jgi:hypothetical protein
MRTKLTRNGWPGSKPSCKGSFDNVYVNAIQTNDIYHQSVQTGFSVTLELSMYTTDNGQAIERTTSPSYHSSPPLSLHDDPTSNQHSNHGFYHHSLRHQPYFGSHVGILKVVQVNSPCGWTRSAYRRPKKGGY